jgi:hypothetical protein
MPEIRPHQRLGVVVDGDVRGGAAKGGLQPGAGAAACEVVDDQLAGEGKGEGVAFHALLFTGGVFE